MDFIDFSRVTKTLGITGTCTKEERCNKHTNDKTELQDPIVQSIFSLTKPLDEDLKKSYCEYKINCGQDIYYGIHGGMETRADHV